MLDGSRNLLNELDSGYLVGSRLVNPNLISSDRAIVLIQKLGLLIRCANQFISILLWSIYVYVYILLY